MIASSVFSKLSSLDLELQQPNGTYRIYPNFVPMVNKQYPQLAFDLDNFQPAYGLDGPDGVPTIDLKLEAIGTDYDTANSLATAVVNALDGTRGTWGETVVQGCFVEEVSESHYVDTDMETILYYIKELTFKVIFVMPT